MYTNMYTNTYVYVSENTKGAMCSWQTCDKWLHCYFHESTSTGSPGWLSPHKQSHPDSTKSFFALLTCGKSYTLFTLIKWGHNCCTSSLWKSTEMTQLRSRYVFCCSICPLQREFGDFSWSWPHGAVVISHWYEQISPAETVLLLLLYPVFSVQSCWLIEFFFLQHFATFLQPPPTFLQPLINFL